MTRALPHPRVGIFGGTFNPIHFGHLRAAEEAAEALGLARVVLVPSAKPPHKRAGDAGPMAKPLERLSWVRLAALGNPRFEVDPLEVERDGPSFTVDTLRALRARLGGGPPVFLIGADAFAEIDGWREPAALFELSHFAVTTRPPRGGESLAARLPRSVADAYEISGDGRRARHRTADTWIRTVEITALDISASDIRRRLREGRSVRYLLPDRVREAVERSGAYRAGEGS